ncbi:hypothetical protein NC652_040208 [Populus alba x Populus x berolinensis]|nr:hypothetical protein NC652_040208 [Populus alba x Populus x berolinensis]
MACSCALKGCGILLRELNQRIIMYSILQQDSLWSSLYHLAMEFVLSEFNWCLILQNHLTTRFFVFTTLNHCLRSMSTHLRPGFGSFL